ncbi:unnamed protein product, partial [Ectocarpus fasciculatus]
HFWHSVTSGIRRSPEPVLSCNRDRRWCGSSCLRAVSHAPVTVRIPYRRHLLRPRLARLHAGTGDARGAPALTLVGAFSVLVLLVVRCCGGGGGGCGANLHARRCLFVRTLTGDRRVHRWLASTYNSGLPAAAGLLVLPLLLPLLFPAPLFAAAAAGGFHRGGGSFVPLLGPSVQPFIYPLVLVTTTVRQLLPRITVNDPIFPVTTVLRCCRSYAGGHPVRGVMTPLSPTFGHAYTVRAVLASTVIHRAAPRLL